MKINKLISIPLTAIIFCGCSNTYDTTTDLSSGSSLNISKNESENVEKNIIQKPYEVMNIRRPNTLNPLLCEDKSVTDALQLVFLNVVEIDKNDKTVLNLISDYSYNSATKTAIIKIKQGIKWQGGQGELNADDFIYSINVLKNAPDSAIYKDKVSNILTYNKIDNMTISISVSDGMIGLPYYLTFPIISQHFFSTYASKDVVHFPTIIGDGPYENTENTVNGDVILKANNLNGSEPEIQNITLKYTDNKECELDGFAQGLTDITICDVDNWNKISSDREVNISAYNNMRMEVLGFNYKKAIFNDLNFRQAINLSIPFNQIQNTIFLGYCDVSRTILPTNHFAYNKNLKFPKLDLNEAKIYIKKTKYDGSNLNFIVSNDSNEMIKVVNLIVANMKVIGINATCKTLDNADFLAALGNGDFDIYVGNYAMTTLPDYSNLFGKTNSFSYKNDDINNLIDEIKNCNDVQQYQLVLNNLQEIVRKQLSVIPLFHHDTAVITNKKISLKAPPTSYLNPFFGISSNFNFKN